MTSIHKPSRREEGQAKISELAIHGVMTGTPMTEQEALQARVVIGTNVPGEVWTAEINKDPADRPVSLST